MLVKAMGVSGIEGSYRSTCEQTMTVLRESRDSFVAMLEAFVYDPLISWRLVGLSSGAISNELDHNDLVPEKNNGVELLTENAVAGVPIRQSSNVLHDSIAEVLEEDDNESDEAPGALAADEAVSISQRLQAGNTLGDRSMSRDLGMSASRARSLQMYANMQEMAAELSASTRIASIAGAGSEHVAAEGSMARSRAPRSLRQREVMSLLEGQAQEEFVNEKALKVIRRVQDKLSGTDFCDMDDTNEPLDVPDQVQRLIVQATSTENLCQLFIGWCAFW